MEQSWLKVREHGVEVRVRLSPRASRERIDGFYGDRLKIRLTAPPVAGAANDALIRLLARAAGLAPSCGRVVLGARDRSKTVLLACDRPEVAAEKLRKTVAEAMRAKG
ncbi:MAG: DUF167 domain-containing protein [Candidatus Dadabacteria bacterium]|nr:MAG: DUF167 domain-containing protein [Candidatus Dadabacteria bacterium]